MTNEYETAFAFSACIAALWVCAYILAWVAQWAWAWIDDSEVMGKNWLVEKVRYAGYNKWIYPVYNSSGGPKRGDDPNGKVPFGYAKKKELDGGSVHGIKEGIDYIYEWRVSYWGQYLTVPLATTISPVVIYVSFVFYPVAIGATTMYLLANLARYARRHKKLFDEHVKDKKAHD